MTQLLHNIRSVSVIEPSHLRNITVAHGSGVFLNYWRNFRRLPLVGLASCEVVSKLENNSLLYTATLNATLDTHFDAAGKTYAFLLTCVNGDRFLMGTDRPPFPAVTTSDIFPGKPSDASGCTLTAKITGIFGLLPVLDWF